MWFIKFMSSENHNDREIKAKKIYKESNIEMDE